MNTDKNLVQVVTRVPALFAPEVAPPSTPPPLRYEVVGEYDSVGAALAAIRDDKHGDGPFDIVTVNRVGLKLRTEHKKILEEGQAFGGRSGSKNKAKAPAPKANDTKKAPAK